jgi:hypothetical protein
MRAAVEGGNAKWSIDVGRWMNWCEELLAALDEARTERDALAARVRELERDLRYQYQRVISGLT